MNCLWCKRQIEGKKYCDERCKTSYWNHERTHAIRVPERFRPRLQAMADGLEIPVVEALSKLLVSGLKMEEQGDAVTPEQIHESQVVPLPDIPTDGQPLSHEQVWGVDQGGTQ